MPKVRLLLFLSVLLIFQTPAFGQVPIPICIALESPPPEGSVPTPTPEIDVGLAHWDSQSKYFVVVSATKSSVPDANLDFSTVNGEFVASRLREHGYQQLNDPLTGEQATKNNFVKALHKINSLPDNGLVVVYYSGHGVKADDDSELWLQLYGEDLGSSFGISVSQLISAAREASYHGELIIVIDSCFSGHGTLNSLSPRQLDKTTILTSSSDIEPSRILTLADNSKSSAFTFFLTEALTNGWLNADRDRDGILEHSELLTYLQSRLTCAKLENKIDGPMSPKPFIFSNERFFAYDQTKVRNWESALRNLLTLEMLSSELRKGNSPPSVTLETAGAATSSAEPADVKLQPSLRAVSLAKLIPSDAEPYARALKLIAEGRASEVISLLSDPVKISNGDLPKLYMASGLAFRYLGRFEEAIETYKKGLNLNKNSPDLLDELAYVYALELKYNLAQQNFKRAIEAKKKELGSEHPELVDTLERYEDVLRKTNQIKKAQIISAQAAGIKTKAGIQ